MLICNVNSKDLVGLIERRSQKDLLGSGQTPYLTLTESNANEA